MFRISTNLREFFSQRGLEGKVEIYKQKDQRYLFLIGFRSDRLGSSVGRLRALVSKRNESRRSFPAVRANDGLIHLGSSFFFS